VARLLAREGARVLAVDFTAEMLALAARKPAVGPPHGPERHAVHYARADALHLPLFDRSADVATIAFGLRNLADRRAGLEELARVLRPGGRLLVLEFSLPPPGAIGALYRLYFTRVLPAVGGLVSGEREAYRYLPDTVLAWPSPGVLQREMEEVGLEACGYRLLLGGVACLSWGRARGGA
jgi:demethylmenaquinone methyltransferase/2-methoxy-6-polyprenyl-1,4-benzoquinol methylase